MCLLTEMGTLNTKAFRSHFLTCLSERNRSTRTAFRPRKRGWCSDMVVAFPSPGRCREHPPSTRGTQAPRQWGLLWALKKMQTGGGGIWEAPSRRNGFLFVLKSKEKVEMTGGSGKTPPPIKNILKTALCENGQTNPLWQSQPAMGEAARTGLLSSFRRVCVCVARWLKPLCDSRTEDVPTLPCGVWLHLQGPK